MKIYIQTRGKTRDYTFLGGEPKEKWWRKPVYEQGTSFEKPTLIIENDANGWRCYISGIPSNRSDRVNTPIRYTLVINGSEKAPAENKNIFLFISSALQTFSTSSRSPLQEVLDKHFNFDLDEFIDKKENIDNIIKEIIKEIIKDKRIEKFQKNEEFNPFYSIIKKEKEETSSAVAFLNLVSNEDYINSDIQPAFKKSDLSRLSLIESLSSGKMFDDLTNPPKEQDVLLGTSSSHDDNKSNKKKVKIMILVIIIIAMATLILNI